MAIGSSVFTRAANLTASQTGPTTWVYDLTFAAWDNYSVFQPNTTITLSGLFGVTAASAPVSTTFPSGLDALNLAWTPQVLNGGTTVVWTHVGGGTGNFAETMKVFGFSLTASGATNGLAALTTSGFSRDISNPLPGGGFNLDFSGFLAGPVAVPEPGVLPLLALGIVAIGFSISRRSRTPLR